MTDGMTVTSRAAFLLQKISVAMDFLCQIVLNQKLLHKFEMWHKFFSRIKLKPRKMGPACTEF